MLSSNSIIQETLALLLLHGIKDIIICPGSRNAGIVHSICQTTDFHTHTVTDERCAGFMAIGMADATDRPVAVVVTSGSALANLYPAACEAYYRNVPVVFISADRPKAWIGQMDGQTMPQEGALGRMVKMSVSLPENDLWHANRLLNEALLCCTARQPKGPVHINIPVSEPIYEFTACQLPDSRAIRLRESMPEGENFTGGNTLILWGQMLPSEVPDAEILAQITGYFTIIAENLSNLPVHSYVNPTRIDWAGMQPISRVITIGGHIISKDLKKFFRTHRPQEHWHVSPEGAVADLFCCQTLAIQSSVRDFLLDILRNVSPQCLPVELPQKEDVTDDFRTDLLKRFFSLLPEGAAVHLANSSAVRLAQAAQNCNSAPAILCNRGINGIEGSLSTAVGYALVKPEIQVYIVTGDLSFFYDRNALWTSPLPNNLHILLLNDGGGGIFNTLPLPNEPEISRKAIMGTHKIKARHTAMQHDLLYLCGAGQMENFINTRETSLLEITLYNETMENR